MMPEKSESAPIAGEMGERDAARSKPPANYLRTADGIFIL
jgi:hypothetical protein